MICFFQFSIYYSDLTMFIFYIFLFIKAPPIASTHHSLSTTVGLNNREGRVRGYNGIREGRQGHVEQG